MSYVVKSIFNTQLYRFSTTEVPSVRELQQQIGTYFSITSPMQMSWIDEDGDQITLRTNEDVKEAFATRLVKIYTTVTQTVVANTNSPITTVSGNAVTTVPITDNGITNAPVSVVPLGNVINTVPIEGNTTNVSPITDSPVTVTNLDGSPITSNVVNISGVNVVSGNNVSPSISNDSPVVNHIFDHNHTFSRVRSNQSSAVPSFVPSSIDNVKANPLQFVRKENSNQWLPVLVQLKEIGFNNSQQNIHLLNRYNGDYLLVLAKLTRGY